MNRRQGEGSKLDMACELLLDGKDLRIFPKIWRFECDADAAVGRRTYGGDIGHRRRELLEALREAEAHEEQ